MPVTINRKGSVPVLLGGTTASITSDSSQSSTYFDPRFASTNGISKTLYNDTYKYLQKHNIKSYNYDTIKVPNICFPVTIHTKV